MKARRQSVEDFHKILVKATQCPLCGTPYEGGRCVDPDCPNGQAAQGGPLGRRVKGLSWTPQAWAIEPEPEPAPEPAPAEQPSGNGDAPYTGEEYAQAYAPQDYAPQQPEPGYPPQYAPQQAAPQYAPAEYAAPYAPPQIDPRQYWQYPPQGYAPPGQYPPQPYPPYAPYPYGPQPQWQPRRRSLGLRAAWIGALAIVVAVGSLVFVDALTSHPSRPAAAAKPQPTFPAAWDPKVQPLVDYVQQARGLSFKHPVSVDFLTPAQYSAAVRNAPLSAKERGEAGQQSELLRTVGLVSGAFDLEATTNQMADQGTLAFYSYEAKRVDVRGIDLTVGLRVTLVHELTHALQDQYFDLGRGEKMSSSGAQLAFRTLVEGDAVRIEDLYEASLPKADRDAYDAEQTTQEGMSKSDLKDIPPSLLTLFGAPYDLGAELLKVLNSNKGNASVDDAFRSPPADELQVFDPWVYLANQQPIKVADPALQKGEKKFDGGDWGALSWFVVLSQRIDPHLALRAADAWGGDAYVAYQVNGRTCLRSDVVAGSPAGTDQLMSAFNAWTQTMPAGAATVTRYGSGLEMVACDPGAAADLKPIASAEDALVLPLARTEWTLELLTEGRTAAQARCAATRVAGTYSAVDLADPNMAAFTSRAGASRLAQLTASCRSAT